MLFVLSPNVIPFCSAKSGPELDGLQNLLLAVRQGHHAITGPHDAFLSLAKNGALSERERATARNLANRRSELPMIEREIRHKIHVEAFLQNSPLKIDSFQWRVNVNDLSGKFLGCLVVLAENMIDAQLYQKAATHYKIFKRIAGLTFVSQARGGGGSQIDVELQSLLSSGVPVIAITDGDCNYDNAPLSIISNRCEIIVGSPFGVGWHFPLPVREVENIVPHDVLLEVADPQMGGDAYRSIKELDAAYVQGGCPSSFSCLKAGYSLSKVFSSPSVNERLYWVTVAETVRNYRGKKFGDCLDSADCDSNKCECIISFGFGSHVLVQVKDWLDKRGDHESFKSFKGSAVWMEVGSRVFDAGVAFSRQNI